MKQKAEIKTGKGKKNIAAKLISTLKKRKENGDFFFEPPKFLMKKLLPA